MVRRLSGIVLCGIIIISTAGLFVSAYLGMWSGAPSWIHGLTNRGILESTAIHGLSRVGFGFFVGVALFRLRDHRYFLRFPPLHPAVSGVILVAIFAAPIGWPDYYNVVTTMAVFPLLLIGSANAEPARWTAAICKFGGWFSYPLYTIHMPIVFLAVGMLKFARRFMQIPTPTSEALVVCVVFLLAYILGKFYDELVRQWLTRVLRARDGHRGALVPAEGN